MRFVESMLRLYAVTDRSWLGGKSLCEQVEAALKGGVTCVQLREKELSWDTLYKEAKELKSLCAQFGVPLIINDNVKLAMEIDADGVHVGQEDMDAREVRALIGKDKILGVTSKTIEQAQCAQRAGADYLGCGAIFGSTTKMNAKTMSRDLLQTICSSVSIPVVAIGGIHLGNIGSLAGIDIRGVAVVSGIFAADDIETECRLMKMKITKIIN